MAKIARFNGNVQAFASNQQAGERRVFGATDPTESDLLSDQLTPEFLRGWATVGASEFPPIEWFNALGFTVTQFIAYLHQIGVPEYNALQEYHSGSICVYGGGVYKSLIDNNIGNDLSNINAWSHISKESTFDTLADAVESTNLQNGMLLDIKERESGLGGGGQWNVVLASTVTPNTFDIVQCTGVPTLALVLKTNAGQVILDKLGCYAASSDAAANQAALEFAMSKYDSLIMIGDYTVHNVKFPNRYLTFRALGRDQCFFVADTSSGDNEYFAAPVTWIDNLNSASERIKTHQVGFDGGTREITLVVHSFFCDFHDLMIRDGVNKGIFQTARSQDGTLISTTMVNNRYHNPWVQGTSDIGFEIDEDGKSTDWQIFGGYLFNGGSKNFQARTMGGAVFQGVHMYGAPVSADLSKWFEGTTVNSCYFENDVVLSTGLNDNVDFQFGPDNTVRGDLILNFGSSVSAVRSHDNILTNVVHNYFGDRKFYSVGDTYTVSQPFSWTSTDVANTASIRVTNALIGQESVSGELSPSLEKNTASSLSRDFGFGNGKDYTQVGSSTAGGAKSASITVPTVAGSNVGVGVNFKLGTRLNHSSTTRVAYKWEGVVYGQGGNTTIFNVVIEEVLDVAQFTTAPTLTRTDNGDGTMTLTFDWEPATSDGYGGWNISVSGK